MRNAPSVPQPRPRLLTEPEPPPILAQPLGRPNAGSSKPFRSFLIPILASGLVFLIAALSLSLTIVAMRGRQSQSQVDQVPVFDRKRDFEDRVLAANPMFAQLVEEERKRQLPVSESQQKKIEREATPVSIHQLVEDYKNEIYGKEKYGDKKLKVTGVLSYGIGGWTLYSKERPGFGVLCSNLRRRDDLYCRASPNGNDVDSQGIEATVVAKCSGEYQYFAAARLPHGGYNYRQVVILRECVLLTPLSEIKRLVEEREDAKKQAQLADWIKREEKVRTSPAVPVGVKNGNWDFCDNETYKVHKVVEVRGEVVAVRLWSQHPFEAFEVTLRVPEVDRKIWAIFRLKKDVERLKPGEIITLRGRWGTWEEEDTVNVVLRKFSALTLEDCSLVVP